MTNTRVLMGWKSDWKTKAGSKTCRCGQQLGTGLALLCSSEYRTALAISRRGLADSTGKKAKAISETNNEATKSVEDGY
jgi:hypothetical protein